MGQIIQNNKNKNQNQDKKPEETSKQEIEVQSYNQFNLNAKGIDNVKDQDKQTNQKKESQRSPKQGGQTKSFSKRVKIAILVTSVLLLFISIGLGIGLGIYLRQKIEKKGFASQINFEDGSSIQVNQFIYLKNHLFEKADNVSVITTSYKISSGDPRNQTRLLQQTQSVTTINFQNLGISVQMEQDNSLSFMINPFDFTNYLIQQQPSLEKIYNDIGNETQLVNDTSNIQRQWKEIQDELSLSLSQEFNGGNSINFEKIEVMVLDMNLKSSQLQFVEPKNSSNRRLLLRRILFIKKVFRSIKRAISAIVRPIIHAVRKAAPFIGAAVGGVVGFIGGGPAGAFAGAKLGFQIGSYAQSFTKACLPQDKLRFRCDSKIFVKQSVKIGISNIFGKITGIDQLKPFAKK